MNYPLPDKLSFPKAPVYLAVPEYKQAIEVLKAELIGSTVMMWNDTPPRDWGAGPQTFARSYAMFISSVEGSIQPFPEPLAGDSVNREHALPAMAIPVDVMYAHSVGAHLHIEMPKKSELTFTFYPSEKLSGWKFLKFKFNIFIRKLSFHIASFFNSVLVILIR